MIKIGIVPSQPFHHSLGTDVRLINLVRSLSKLNVEIHFITPYKCDALPKNEKVYVHTPNASSSSSMLSEKVYSITRMLFDKPFWSRNLLLNEFVLEKIVDSFAYRIHKLSVDFNVDIILSELEIASMACIKLRDSIGVPVVADIHGTWSEETIAADVVQENSRQAETLRRFERDILRGADAVIVVSEEAKRFFKEFYGVPESKTTVVPGGSFPRVDKAKNVENPSKIVFSGTISYREHTDLFIKSMPFVLNEYPSARFYLTKKGDKVREILKLATRMHLNPEFFYYPSTEGFFDFLKSCHIGVLTSSCDIPRRIAYPAKLFDYMSVGLPVVSNDVGTWTRIIEENRIGIVTEDSPREFATAMLELLKNPDLFFEYGQRGLNLIKTRFNYDASAKMLYNVLERIKNK